MASHDGGGEARLTIEKLIQQTISICDACRWISIQDILKKETLWHFIDNSINTGKYKAVTAKCYIGAI